MEYQLINLTPHDVVVENEKEGFFKTYPKTGREARVDTTEELVGRPGGCPLYRTTYGKAILNVTDPVTGEKRTEELPEPQENVGYIVSFIVRDALRGQRSDLFSPDSGKNAKRNEKGHILSVPGLIC